MKPSIAQPMSLADFGISPEQGFLPSDPCQTLPDCPTLNQLAQELPRLLSARQVQKVINAQPSLLQPISSAWRDDECRAAMRVLSFTGHAYVWLPRVDQQAVHHPGLEDAAHLEESDDKGEFAKRCDGSNRIPRDRRVPSGHSLA
ncbi:MAG: hypothetical protein FJ247_00085 [Nitrospira sp.]|nr:hypothetical protein [Nitrospira sp.]